MRKSINHVYRSMTHKKHIVEVKKNSQTCFCRVMLGNWVSSQLFFKIFVIKRNLNGVFILSAFYQEKQQDGWLPPAYFAPSHFCKEDF